MSRTLPAVWLGLMFVSLSARAHAGEPVVENVFGLPGEAVRNSGALVIAGGGKLSDEIYDEFVRLAGGEQARLVLIPSAYPYSDMDHVRRAFGGWREYKVATFDFLHTDDPAEADTARFAQVLERATGVWIAGGAQGRLTYRYGNSKTEVLLRRVVERGGVVGGTSAGASALSQQMIRDGSATEAVVDRGLGLASQMVIDQHFSQRGRFPRLLGVLEENPGQIGLGVDEETAVVLHDNQLRVLGTGRAALCFGPTHTGDGSTVHLLKSGEAVDIIRHPDSRATARHTLRRR